MTEKNCPNYQSCRLVNAPEFETGKITRAKYILTYCIAGEENWSICKRYQTKEMMGFCPDFVLPDTAMTVEEIIDKFDEEEFDNKS